MTKDDENESPKTGLERHVQTIVIGITLALLLWTGNTLIDLRDKVSRFEEKVLALQVQLQASSERNNSDQNRERLLLESRMDRFERRLDAVESHTRGSNGKSNFN